MSDFENNQLTAIFTEIAKLNVKVDSINEQIKAVTDIDKRVVKLETQLMSLEKVVSGAKWAIGLLVTIVLAILGLVFKQ